MQSMFIKKDVVCVVSPVSLSYYVTTLLLFISCKPVL